MAKPNGVVLYTGKSLFDGKDIVVVATGFAKTSRNPKTGNMIQTFIMCSDPNPFTAKIEKHNYSVCGDCKNRINDTCYVNVAQSVLNVWKAWQRGNYPILDKENINWFNGRELRIGSYGDPAAAPVMVWNKLVKRVNNFCGYTHQWQKFPKYKKFCMASVETEDEKQKALSLGWRTFRVRNSSGKVLKDELICPASEEGGKKIVCAKCCACSGVTSKLPKSIVIIAHGKQAKKMSNLIDQLQEIR